MDQNIESYWNRCKTKIKSMKGVRRDMLPGYLDEFMWRERAGADKFNAILNEICAAISGEQINNLKTKKRLKNGSFWNQQIYKRSLNKIAIFLTFLTLLFHIIKGGVYSNDHLNIRHPMHRGGGALTSIDP